MTISNNIIQAEISTHGAELTSLKKDGQEHIWFGDPSFWNRHSPILFPIVGKVVGNHYTYNGQDFSLPQHGFARDSDFVETAHTDESVTMVLTATPESKTKYPFDFALKAHYSLDGNRLRCHWTVENNGNGPLWFQIGAHPAFLYRPFEPGETVHGFIQLLKKIGDQFIPCNDLVVSALSPDGYLMNESTSMHLDSGTLPLDDHTFANGALVIEHHQVQKAILMDPAKKARLCVSFENAPVLGLWSANKPRCPFVCIEPWHGRCDKEHFAGDFSQREWINSLPPQQAFSFDYSIELL